MKYHALATDYDGTIAHHGLVDAATLSILEQLKESGRKLLLVTGRELPDLFNVFPEPDLFDRIVAENGALLYEPRTKRQKPLAPEAPPGFADTLRERGVSALSVGRVIVATQEMYSDVVRQVIAQFNLDLQVIMNKGAVMVLPSGVDKATGLTEALADIGLKSEDIVGVGDAENDTVFLEMCGFSVAVANALPMLKERVDYVAKGDHGSGVRELARMMIEERLPETAPDR